MRNIVAKLPPFRQLQRLVDKVDRIRKYNLSIEAHLRVLHEMEVARFYADHLKGPRYADPRSLAHFEHRVYSQSGEDGILTEIFRRIGSESRFCVEFGASSGSQNNTTYLLAQGWRGLWIEGDATKVADIKRNIADSERLRLLTAFITAENIESLFKTGGVPTEFDLLSIDIDGNDYWVWKAITNFHPRVVIVEYNPHLGAEVSLARNYDPQAHWDGSIYFSATLKAFEKLGTAKGYSLVGCTLSGVNAFFVRSDLCADKFVGPFTAEHHYENQKSFLSKLPVDTDKVNLTEFVNV